MSARADPAETPGNGMPASLLGTIERNHLALLGGFHPGADDGVPGDCGTLLLLGPGPGFWHAVTRSPEWRDGAADPVDRWSSRVIGALAAEMGGSAFFPFGGPPYLPFFSWALRTERIHASPIRLLVHDSAGLMVSFRGALALAERIDLPTAPPAPCESCDARPCLSACPVSAFDGAGYDVAACKGYLDTAPGQDCMQRGCAARRACPASRGAPVIAPQAAYHMSIFKG